MEYENLDLIVFLWILLYGVSMYLIKQWIIRKMQYSVKFEYDNRLEELRKSKDIKLRATLVAELLAEWLSNPEDVKQLNKLTFEAFLWLPNDISLELSNLLSHNPGSKNVREIIISVRQYLLEETKRMDANEVIVFSKDLMNTEMFMKRDQKND